MSGNRVALGDALATVIDHRGKTPKKLGGDWSSAGHRVISAINVKESRVDDNDHHYVDDNLYLKWMKEPLRAGDVLLTSEAPTGEVAYLAQDEDWCLGQRVFGLRGKPDVLHGRYLYYSLRGGDVRHQLMARATGTTVSGIRQSELVQVELDLPPIAEQKGIAATLGALDDKLDSNRRVRQLAESLAQSLFQSWFVQYKPWGGEAPATWHRGRLADVLSQVKQPTKAHAEPDRPYVPVDMLPMRSLGLDDYRPNEDARSSLLLFEKDDILIGAMRVYFHRVSLAPFAGITRSTTFVLRPVDQSYLDFALLLCNEDSTIDFAEGTSRGSTMPYAVWDSGLADRPVVIPPPEVAQEFSTKVRPLLERVRDGLFEHRRLIALRDELLPALLSGATRVPEAREAVENVG